ncbi:MAG: hypothetical protein ABSH53_07455 [Holophaga sp.]
MKPTGISRDKYGISSVIPTCLRPFSEGDGGTGDGEGDPQVPRISKPANRRITDV